MQLEGMGKLGVDQIKWLEDDLRGTGSKHAGGARSRIFRSGLSIQTGVGYRTVPRRFRISSASDR
jgi:hypothetical protein